MTSFKNIALLLISITLTLLVLEGLIRVLDNLKSKSLSKDYSKIYSDERNISSYVFGHKENVSILLSDEKYKFRITTNSMGIREQEDFNQLKDSILFIGDSVIEGMVNDNETIDYFFEEISGITSINLGLGAANTVHEYYYLKEKYRDDWMSSKAILGICVNDVKQNHYLRAFNEETGNWELFEYLDKTDQTSGGEDGGVKNFNLMDNVKKSRLIMFTYSSIAGLFKDTDNFSAFHLSKNFSEKDLDLTIAYVNKIKSFLDKKDVKLYVVVFPTRDQILSDNLLNGVQQTLKSRLLSQGIKVIDVDREIINVSNQMGINEVWLDNIHPKASGNKVIANKIYKYLND
tara:strand:- start:25423 stop:26460 length:1038 start_codon:yes stop_codon:yes gene_type:complete